MISSKQVSIGGTDDRWRQFGLGTADAADQSGEVCTLAEAGRSQEHQGLSQGCFHRSAVIFFMIFLNNWWFFFGWTRLLGCFPFVWRLTYPLWSNMRWCFTAEFPEWYFLFAKLGEYHKCPFSGKRTKLVLNRCQTVCFHQFGLAEPDLAVLAVSSFRFASWPRP